MLRHSPLRFKEQQFVCYEDEGYIIGFNEGFQLNEVLQFAYVESVLSNLVQIYISLLRHSIAEHTALNPEEYTST